MDLLTKKDIKLIKIFLIIVTFVIAIVFGSIIVQNIKLVNLLKNNTQEKVYEDMLYYKNQYNLYKQLYNDNIIINSCINRQGLIEYLSETTHKSLAYVQEVVNQVFTHVKYPILMLSIIEIESTFNRKAVSSKDAIGLTQVRFVTWVEELKKLGYITKRTDLFFIKKNIVAGDYVFRKYYAKCNQNVIKALNAYNTGECNKSVNYSKQVLNEFARLYMICRGFDFNGR